LTERLIRPRAESLEARFTPSAPAAPVIIEPLTDGQVVSNFDVHMEADPEAYADPDGDAHQSTNWQIRESATNGGATVWQANNVTEPLSKVHIHLGDGDFVGTLSGRTALLPSRDYVLRCTFIDSRGEVSATFARTFRTAAATTPVPGAGTWVVQEGYAVEPAATPGAFGLPVNIAFLPNPGPNPTDPLFYVTELYGSIKTVARNGQVSTYASGLLDYDPTGPFPGLGEQGLTGVAVDPATGDLFVSMLWNNGTSDATRGAANLHYPKVERLHSTDGGRTMASRTLVLNMQPETQGQSHQISNVSIGPDGKLYVHMGDGLVAAPALDLNQYRGKVLRMNLDGSAPADNPFYDAGNGINARDYVYTYGHRNPFGGAWRASNNAHYVVENGNSIDRMARLAAGQSYGWNGNDSSLIATSIYNWQPSTAPVNMVFVQPQTFGGSLFPASSQDDAFVSMSGPTYSTGPQTLGKRIEWFRDLDTLNGSGKLAVAPTTLLRYNGTGRGTVTSLAAGPDGLYFADLYRDDGVGGPTAGGANVYRLRYVDFHPTGVSAAAGDARVTLDWTPEPLAVTHNVYRRVGNGAPVLVGSAVSGNSFTDTTAVNGTHYRYVVRGVNAGGESNDSNEASATPNTPQANQPPSVVTPAAATPNPVTGTTATLSVLGADDAGEGNLVYTWAVQGAPPAAVAFGPNGTNAAKNTTATFAAAGVYDFVVTALDAGGQTAQGAVSVTVNQALASVSVSPAGAVVATGGTLQLNAVARDQFGNALAAQPALTWGIDPGGVGTVDAAGLYRAPATGTGAAVVRATTSSVSGAAAVGVSAVAPGTGNGLAAVYFNNADLTGTSVVRTDPAVSFDFGAAAPDPFITPDTFSARWVGFVEPRFSEAYTFTTTSDDGVRLWVDGAPVIDQWNGHGAARHGGTVALVAGRRHAIRLEYYQDAGPAVIGLEWQSASQPAEVVPRGQLYSGSPVRVNFQPARASRATVPVPSGYLADNGAVFADRGNGYAYGWARKNGREARDRNNAASPDQRYDTYLRLGKRAWELAVPNGTYRIHAVSGDPKSFRGAFKVNAEGVPLIDGPPSKAGRWLEGWADVTVGDGRLTITNAPRARNNKINFVDVIPLDSAGGAGAGAGAAPAAAGHAGDGVTPAAAPASGAYDPPRRDTFRVVPGRGVWVGLTGDTDDDSWHD
jgi:glucose/arabinose dehydrogenase